MQKLIFPAGFYWGAATSSHQVEGGNSNDWTQWERNNAKRLAREAKHIYQKWQQDGFPEMFNVSNYISGSACDHYNRFEEDFDIAKSLGHNAHRFSMEWSRIEPKEGRFDEKEIGHYRRVIEALRERGIEPFVTLWHWTLPLWLSEKGGVNCREFPALFARYAKKMADSLGDSVKFWITINEPEIYSSHAYFKGDWPPQNKGYFKYIKINNNLIKSHKKAYGIIKSINTNFNVGIAKNNIHFEDDKNKIINSFLKRIADWWWNFHILNRIKNHQDFIGLNHYFHNRIDYGFNKNEDKILSDLGWELYPGSIHAVLIDLKRYNKPIYITENGLADARDKNRVWFINKSLESVGRAIKDGVDVRGYLHWSLLDNFEWDKGFWPRFGLVEVDYNTMERKIRPSAFEYAKICKTNNLIL